MRDLNELALIAGDRLAGLKADARLKDAISRRAFAPRPRRSAYLKPAALCAAIALCVVIGLTAYLSPGEDVNDPMPSAPVMDSQPAGMTSDSVTEAEARALMDVPSGSISMKSGGTAEFSSIFAIESAGNFPLIMADGRTYRMLKTPKAVPESMLGEELGTVSEYTLEPALSTGGGIVSNSAMQGETVRAIAGMKGAMIAASVDGVMRAFQRVSFSGGAILGGETLRDTLCAPGSVVALELTGVGAVTDRKTVQCLMETLYDNAVFIGRSVSLSAAQALTIKLESGLTMQLMVADEALSACGNWSCPEFFEDFQLAVSAVN